MSLLSGFNAGIAGLLITVVLLGLGERIGERFLPVYLLAMGSSLFAPSLLNALDNFLSALYSIPGGWVSSRFGYKRALLYFNLFAIIGYVIVIVFSGWLSVIIGSVFFLSWSSLSLPACMDLIHHEVPKNKQVFGVSLHSLVKRVPMAIGPLLGGVLIDTFGISGGIRISFILAIVFGVIAIVVQQSVLKDIPNPKTGLKPVRDMSSANTDVQGSAWILPWKFPFQLQVLLYSDILAKFCSQIPFGYVAVWAMEYARGAHVSATQFGMLTSFEMIIAIIVYIPIGLLGDRFKKKWFILSTFILYVLFPVVLFFSRSFEMLLVAFFFRGLKEFGEPTRKAQIMELSPDGQKALYFGAYYFFRDILVTCGVLLGGVLWLIAPELNLVVAFAFGLCATTLYAIFGR